MKKILSSLKLSAILGLLILAAGCAATKHTENFLTAAGFRLIPATTPKQEQKLRALPSDKITTVQRNGKTYYVFPDVTHNRIYLGTPNEYQNYRQILADNKIAGQDRMSAEMETDGADDWNDWDSWDMITWMSN